MRETDVVTDHANRSSRSSIGTVSRYDAIFQAATELVALHSNKHGAGIDFSLILWSDDAQWIFRNETASVCIARLARAKVDHEPSGGTNFSNAFRLLREGIEYERRSSGGSSSSSVVIFLSDGRPGDLCAQPPTGNKNMQSTYKSHRKKYDSAAVHLSALTRFIPNGGLHFVGIHPSGYPWLRWLAAKYNGCFHQSSLDFGTLTTASTTTNSGGGRIANESRTVAAEGNKGNDENNDDEDDDIELVDVISAERRVQMNLANAEVISLTRTQTQTQTQTSIRDTFASLSQSITTVHESASQRAHKERRVVVKAESNGASSTSSADGRKYTATKLILSGDKFEPLPGSKDITVWLSCHPFAQGGERNVYRMREDVPEGQSTLSSFLSVERQTRAKCQSVAKESRKEIPYKNRILFHKQQIACQERAQKIADAFNDSCSDFLSRLHRIRFIKCELLRVNDVQSGSGNYRYLSVEEALDEGDTSTAPYPYVKYNGNNGYKLDCSSNRMQESVKFACEVAQAFSHYSYIYTNKKEMVVDLQGCLLKLTDPQIHSLQKEYGCGDRGERGFQDFFGTHECGQTCKDLGLPPCHEIV